MSYVVPKWEDHDVYVQDWLDRWYSVPRKLQTTHEYLPVNQQALSSYISKDADGFWAVIDFNGNCLARCTTLEAVTAAHRLLNNGCLKGV